MTYYYFYIIYSKSLDRFYIGHTNNMESRLSKHNAHHKGFTGKVNDWVIVYNEEYLSKSEAYARERQVKSWKSRKKINGLIGEGNN
ncbi:GIY-YIG nuclease family protein [Reichenbachiella sp. MALMAid0571]|uniref:GIY-YIG nuclease family protein n=1 Tax=Reichenbachiella sp. MALMAid0571 TaxID=3143939 RepID=UPI0032DE9461